MIRADQAVKDAVFERRSCGTGTKGPRLADWALTATASPRHFLLIRRLISRPGQLTFYLCYAPESRPATMPYFIAIAGRRWPVEETFKTGKDVLGWDQCQARAWDAACPAHRPIRPRPAPPGRHPQRPVRPDPAAVRSRRRQRPRRPRQRPGR